MSIASALLVGNEPPCLCEQFSGLPLIGTYGSGQIALTPPGGNRLLQNAVVTALISTVARRSDVQSKP